MDKVDEIFGKMEKDLREELKINLQKYRSSGDVTAKRAVLKIIGECDDADAVRRFLKEL